MVTKYTTKREKLVRWTKEVINSLDDQPRQLSQVFAVGLIEGFKRHEVLEVLESYRELGEVYFNLETNVIYSGKMTREIKEELKEGFDGIIIKKEEEDKNGI